MIFCTHLNPHRFAPMAAAFHCPSKTRCTNEENYLMQKSCLGSTRRGLHKQMTYAGFNRRMRKTACPVVWKACGAKSP